MDTLDDILDVPANAVFHPVHQRSERAWFPGNEAASLVVQCKHIWEDISALAAMHREIQDRYRSKLLLKCLFVELRSLLEVFDRLQALVMKAIVFDPAKERPWRGIMIDERQRANLLYKQYSSAKASTERMILDVRNNIGAHRGNINWSEVMAFWDAVTIDALAPLLEVIPKVFEHVKDLNIYEWNRLPKEGVVEILGSQIFPDDFI